MKNQITSFIAVTLLATLVSRGQGSFIYDQQSGTDERPFPGAGTSIRYFQPHSGQSLTPTLASVGFIRLNLNDANPNSGLGATMYVNLRSVSITGPVLGSSATFFMPDGFAGVTNSLFIAPVAVTPSVTYFFEPLIQSGDDCGIIGFIREVCSWPDQAPGGRPGDCPGRSGTLSRRSARPRLPALSGKPLQAGPGLGLGTHDHLRGPVLPCASGTSYPKGWAGRGVAARNNLLG